MSDADYPRTVYEAKLDIDYSIRLFALNERVFLRMEKSAKLLELVAGSGAFYAITAGHAEAVKWLSLLVASVALASLVFDPAGRARSMRDALRAYLDLAAEADAMTLEKIDQRRALLGKEEPPVIQGLCRPAFNQNLQRHARGSYSLPLNWWERLLQVVA